MRRLFVTVAALAAAGGAWAQSSAESVHEMASRTTVAAWAKGAQLYGGLGDFHRAVSTRVPAAQQYFDQGMRLLWAFNHDEATRSFARAAQEDPDCAACYWGVALTVGPNYNMPVLFEPRARVAWEALQQAEAHAAQASPVERALIEALARRYPSPRPIMTADLAPVVVAYAAAMRAVAARFPDDADVQVLCAEAHMGVHAWKLWRHDGTAEEGTEQIVAQLEAVLRRDPTHPGANHYYVHVMEASPVPERALPSAQRLRDAMPAAGHLVHMPAHILQRVGDYEAAAEANRRGAAADEAYFKSTAAPDYYAMYWAHNWSFLAYSTAMEGRKQETLTAVRKVAEVIPLEMVLGMGDSGWNLSQQYVALVRFGLWDELIALLPPDASAPGLTAGYLYGRGTALAARGRLDEARASLEQLRQLAARTPPDAVAGLNLFVDVLAIAQPALAARIAASERRDAEAVALLTTAVAAEDRLSYDEPSDWFLPVRHLLGAQLLNAGSAAQAEAVYRADLRQHPHNGWALKGLQMALSAQGKKRAATQVGAELETAWQHADFRLPGSAYWIAGADTAACACEHLALQRQAGGELLGAQHEAGVD